MAVLSVALASGCASAPVRVHRYPSLDLTVIRGTMWQVNEACDGVRKWDDGRPRRPGSPVLGCWKPYSRQIWVVDDCRGARAILHELGHADGSFGREVDAVDWQDGGVLEMREDLNR